MCGVVWCCTDPEPADELLAPARALDPALDAVAEMPLPMLNSAFDGLYPPATSGTGAPTSSPRSRTRRSTLHAEWGAKMATWKSAMHLYPIDGAQRGWPRTTRPGRIETRNWAQVIVGVDPDPANAGVIRDWCVGYWEALHPYSLGGGP